MSKGRLAAKNRFAIVMFCGGMPIFAIN